MSISAMVPDHGARATTIPFGGGRGEAARRQPADAASVAGTGSGARRSASCWRSAPRPAWATSK
jgi:hypothetical protein